MLFTSLITANITWQPAAELFAPVDAIATEVAIDATGNALNVVTYSDVVFPLALTGATSIHTATGTSWGDLASIGSTGQLAARPFARASGEFVVILANAAGDNIYSQTITTNGTLGSLKTITTDGFTFDATRIHTASNPSGNAIIGYTSSTPTSSVFSIYTAANESGTPWSTPVSTPQGFTISQQVVAADANNNYGIALTSDGGVGKAAFKIGNAPISSYRQFDTGILDGSLAFTAQVKATDSDGFFLITYIKSNNVYAQIKDAGSSTTLENLGQVSDTGDTLTTVKANLNKSGNGVAAWLTNDGKLLAAKYSASTNTFSSPITIATDATNLANVASNSSGDFHIFFSATSESIETMKSVTMLSTASIWSTPTSIYANTSGASVGLLGASSNPRGVKSIFAWVIETSFEYFAAFGSSPPSDNHGSAGGGFMRGKNKFRPKAKVFR